MSFFLEAILTFTGFSLRHWSEIAEKAKKSMEPMVKMPENLQNLEESSSPFCCFPPGKSNICTMNGNKEDADG